MTATRFHAVDASPDGVRRMFDRTDRPLVLVSRHGLGDNVFFSPCFEPLQRHFGRLSFASSVNAYASLFHDSPLVQVLPIGGVNGENLGLDRAEGFVDQFQRWQLDLGIPDAWVYHFGLFECSFPYEDERAFVKGRRNLIELFGDGPPATEVPQYHAAPDSASARLVQTLLNRWFPDRELIVLARSGHTDAGKNFGHDASEGVETARRIDERFPGRFKYLSLDYLAGDHALEGRRPNIRSVYGFLPCDAAALHHALRTARLLITVPTGAMLVGATIPSLPLLTLWKSMKPYHFLDPQFAASQPVHALVHRADLADLEFSSAWPAASRQALADRWRIRIAPICAETVAEQAAHILESTDALPRL